jgi:hypothetical protein
MDLRLTLRKRPCYKATVTMIALGNKMARSLFVIALLVAIAAPAYADLTVDFSDTVKQAVDPNTQKQIQDMINAGLKNRAKANADARGLLGSNQTLKIICYGEPKADELGMKAPDPLMSAILGGFGETVGDFDANGKPKSGGTVYVAIDCDKLRANGWYGAFDHLAGKQTMWEVMVHELLHAANRGHRHPPEDLSVYNDWVEAFNQTIRKEIRQAQTAAEKSAMQKTGGDKVGAVPRETTEMFAFVDNRPGVLACIASGQNLVETASAIGLASHQFVASSPTGTIIRGPGDPETVNRLAQQRRITLCFPAESDVCIIMTPLTPFRGHNHEAHQGAVHEHDAPDPPLDWGVTPPETVVRFSP